MSDTPRTDAEERTAEDGSSDALVVDADFARQLERELAAEKKRAYGWKREYLNAVSILRRERTGR